MDWWTSVSSLSQAFLDRHGILAGFVFVLIEEAGVPVPVPGDILMLLAGVRAREGHVGLWEALVSLEAATVLGSSLLYVVSARAGRGLVYRYGRFLHVSPQRLDAAAASLRRRGVVAVFLGRLIPGLRIVTALACGVFEIPYRVFLPGMAVGAFVYICLYTLLGYFIGPPVVELLSHVNVPLGLFGSLIPLVVLLVWLVRARRGLPLLDKGIMPPRLDRGTRLRSGATGGAIAALVAVLLQNVLVHVLGTLPLSDPLTEMFAARLRFGAAGDALLVVLGDLIAFALVGIAWGMVYTSSFERQLGARELPDVARGLAFAMIPLAFTLLLDARILGLGASLDQPADATALLGAQLVRYLVYGAILGSSCPIFLRVRPRIVLTAS